MRRENEFLKQLCHLYVVGMTVFLPLYTGGTYFNLGDTKYGVFRNLTLLCLGIWLAVLIWEVPGSLRRQLENRIPWNRKVSAMDLFMLLYGGAVLVSAFCSQYEGTPWTGYQEWYMGAVSQLLFVGIYFFVSRCYDGREYPALLWIGGFFLVTLFGILHRLGVDVLGVLKGYGRMDWVYSHMLSTVGNINWFCGYAGVSLALPVAGFLKSRGGWQRAALYVAGAAGLFLLFIQGSDIGVVMTAVCLLVCLVRGLGEKGIFRGTLLLLAGMSFLLPCYARLAAFLGEDALMALPEDSIGWRVIGSNAWWAVGAGALGLWFLLWKADGRAPEFGGTEAKASGDRDFRRGRRLRGIAVALLFLALAGGAAFFLRRQPSGEMWGSGRGALWRVSLEGFRQSGPLQKLIGVGPDCFAEYIYSSFTGDELSIQEGRWAGSVYANAHNEWLNQLVNLGIIGTGLYLGIFVSAAVRYRRYLPAVLAVAMYGTCSLTGFQQCMSTPLLFLLMGMCESGLRRGSPEEAGQEGRKAENEGQEAEEA